MYYVVNVTACFRFMLIMAAYPEITAYA